MIGMMGGLGGLVDPCANEKAAQQAPSPRTIAVPVAPEEPTVGEYLKEQIVSAQEHIKQAEARYAQAKAMRVLDLKVRDLRELVGW